jgi:hypothetical protein
MALIALKTNWGRMFKADGKGRTHLTDTHTRQIRDTYKSLEESETIIEKAKIIVQ